MEQNGKCPISLAWNITNILLLFFRRLFPFFLVAYIFLLLQLLKCQRILISLLLLSLFFNLSSLSFNKNSLTIYLILSKFVLICCLKIFNCQSRWISIEVRISSVYLFSKSYNYIFISLSKSEYISRTFSLPLYFYQFFNRIVLFFKFFCPPLIQLLYLRV